MVFYIESDPATTEADLNGTGTNTQGDWVDGTPYPIFDGQQLQLGQHLPGSCLPNGLHHLSIGGVVNESYWNGTSVGTFQHAQIAFGCGNAISGPAATVSYNGDESSARRLECQRSIEQPRHRASLLRNSTSTSRSHQHRQLDRQCWRGGNAHCRPGRIHWIWRLRGRPPISLNGQTRNASTSATIIGAASGTDMLVVKVTPDCWPEEISWEIRK